MKSLSITVVLLLLIQSWPGAALAARSRLALEFGSDVELISNKDVSIRVACLREAAVDRIRVYGVTLDPETLLVAGSAGFGGDGNGGFLLPGTDPALASVAELVAPLGQNRAGTGNGDGFILGQSRLRGLRLSLDSMMLVLNPPGGQADCAVGLDYSRENSFPLKR